MIFRTLVIFGFLLSSLFIFNIQVYSQELKPAGESYFSSAGKDEDMKALVAETKPFIFSYGGWIESTLIDFKSGNDSTTSRLTSSVTIAKLWMKVTLPFNSYLYIRGRDIYTDYLKRPENSGIEKVNNDPDLDTGFYTIATSNKMFRFYAGRKFYILGTGLIFNGRGDGGELDIFSRFINATVFGAYTGLLSEDSNPYRLSSSELSNDKGKRIFAGAELSKTFFNQTIYAIGLMQTDKNDSDTKYDSIYYGLGLNGVLKDALYYGEFIYEQGTSYTGTNEKKDISATAAIAGLNYFFNVTTSPALLLDYAFGSGDLDREAAYSPTGNTSNKDHGFMYFGTFVGGYALRPYLANIHIYRAGFAVSPFDSFDNLLLKRINFSAKYSYYRKDKKKPINTGEATNTNKSVGQAADFSVKWKAFSDLSFYVNYGLFFPGAAYLSGEKTRTFAMAGVYLSF